MAAGIESQSSVYKNGVALEQEDDDDSNMYDGSSGDEDLELVEVISSAK